MRPTTAFAIAVSVASLAAAPRPAAAAPPGPYDVKSGIIEVKTSSIAGGKDVVYFDDHGRREARYSTTSGVIAGQKVETVNVEIRTPEKTYRWDAKKKTGFITPGMVPARQDQAPPDARTRAEYHYKELPDRTIAGKPCTGRSMEMMKGMVVKSWTWKGIALRIESGIGTIPVTMEAVKIEVDVPVPPEKFQVPGDVVLKKL